MATILMQGTTGDGYDVACLLSSGQSVVYHFPARPDDAQAVVNALETASEDAKIVYDILGE